MNAPQPEDRAETMTPRELDNAQRRVAEALWAAFYAEQGVQS